MPSMGHVASVAAAARARAAAACDGPGIARAAHSGGKVSGSVCVPFPPPSPRGGARERLALGAARMSTAWIHPCGRRLRIYPDRVHEREALIETKHLADGRRARAFMQDAGVRLTDNRERRLNLVKQRAGVQSGVRVGWRSGRRVRMSWCIVQVVRQHRDRD